MNLVSQANIRSATIIEEQLAVMLVKKEGDEELVRAWKEHNDECRRILSKVEAISVDLYLMHRKVD